MVEPAIKKCPKCNGQGMKRYRFWLSDLILRNLIYLKAGYPLEALEWSTFVLKIRCPLCDGDGIFDWIKNATKGHINKKFSKLEGNIDIYWLKAVATWPINSSTHTWILVRDTNIYKNSENIIKCSQKRYRGIKLDESVLTMRVRHLELLGNKIEAFYSIVAKLPKKQITKGRVIKEMSSLGLSEFLPDKFAYPGPDDFTV
ncbi:hypothetical protein ACFL36_01280 [Thermodesulfobacteriota bacterium]